MSTPPAGCLALIGALAREDPEAAARILESTDWDGAAFERFATHHRVAGWTWKQLSHLGLAPQGAYGAALRGGYLRQWAKNERLLLEAAKLALRLKSDGIDHLFLKGPFFAVRFYGDLDARGISDLDLLFFDRQSLFAAEAVVESLGYRRTSMRPLGHELTRRFAHHYTYRRDDLAVELHWALQSHYSFRIDHGAIRHRGESIAIGNRHFPVAAALDELTLQILSAFTDAQIGEFRLRTLIDIHRLLTHLEPKTDWDSYFAELRAARLARIGTAVLAACMLVLGCEADVPRLAEQLAATREAGPRSSDDAWRLLDTHRLDPLAKLRNLRLYDAALAGCLLWWVASLPVRVGVYR